MSAYLIQVSGHLISENSDPQYQENAKGDRFCDEPLYHHRYYNASPYWRDSRFGRYDAWQSISPGDVVVLYCTGSVDEHGTCISHLLTVGAVSTDRTAGALLEFSESQELETKISYSEIQSEVEAGRLSRLMGYCGQEGFNLTKIPDSDLERIQELATPQSDPDSGPSNHPDESLKDIVDEYFGE